MYTQRIPRIRSTVLKKDRDAENKNTWTEMALPLQAGGLPNATQACQDSSVSPPKQARPGGVEVLFTSRDSKRRAGRLFLVSLNRPCMDAESPLTQGHLPRSVFDLPEHPTASSAYHGTRRR